MVPFVIGGVAAAALLIALFSDDESKKTTYAKILLLGRTGAGKSTLSKILAGKGFLPDIVATTSGITLKEETDICGVHCKVIDISGAKENAKFGEKVRKKLENLPEDERKKSIFIYVFDAEDFVRHKDRREDILLKVEAYFGQVMDYKIRMKCIGTRRDKISGAERDSVVARIRKAVNVDTEIFDMTTNPVEQIKEFISREV
nr:GTPase domain-containing protein [uncultured Campylobacter sp.]